MLLGRSRPGLPDGDRVRPRGRRRKALRSWRRSRPFWGGLFIVAAGAELLWLPFALDALSAAITFGAVGASYLIALIMMVAGILVWLQPAQRIFLGLVAVVLSMASFVYSNLGGLLAGMILGLLGGTLAMAWAPDHRPGNRLDTAGVRSTLTAARTFASRASATTWTATAALGRRFRRPAAPASARVETGKTREPAG